MIFTHTGMVDSNKTGRRRVPLVKSGKYWKSEEYKFDHNGHAFGSFGATLKLSSIKEIK